MDDKQVQNVVREIIQTEENHVKYLRLIVDHFQNPLQKRVDDRNDLILSDIEMKAVFSNVSTLKTFNEQFLVALKKAAEEDLQTNINAVSAGEIKKRSKVKNIATVFLKNAPFLQLYVQFVNDFEKSAMMLSKLNSEHKKFSEFLKQKREDPICNNLDLPDMLIMGVQRCPRYELLLQDLLRKTSKEDPGYQTLQEALAVVKEVNMKINEKKRLAENLNRAIQIQNQFPSMKENIIEPHRVFQDEGEFIRITDNQTKKNAGLFLFNDIIVLGFTNSLSISKRKSMEISKTYFVNYRILSLPNTEVKHAISDDALIIQTLRTQDKKIKSYTLELDPSITQGRKEKTEQWIRKIEEAIRRSKSVSNPSKIVKAGVETNTYFHGHENLAYFALAAFVLALLLPYLIVGVLFPPLLVFIILFTLIFAGLFFGSQKLRNGQKEKSN